MSYFGRPRPQVGVGRSSHSAVIFKCCRLTSALATEEEGDLRDTRRPRTPFLAPLPAQADSRRVDFSRKPRAGGVGVLIDLPVDGRGGGSAIDVAVLGDRPGVPDSTARSSPSGLRSQSIVPPNARVAGAQREPRFHAARPGRCPPRRLCTLQECRRRNAQAAACAAATTPNKNRRRGAGGRVATRRFYVDGGLRECHTLSLTAQAWRQFRKRPAEIFTTVR